MLGQDPKAVQGLVSDLKQISQSYSQTCAYLRCWLQLMIAVSYLCVFCSQQLSWVIAQGCWLPMRLRQSGVRQRQLGQPLVHGSNIALKLLNTSRSTLSIMRATLYLYNSLLFGSQLNHQYFDLLAIHSKHSIVSEPALSGHGWGLCGFVMGRFCCEGLA